MAKVIRHQIGLLTIALMALGGCTWPNQARSGCSPKLAPLMAISDLLPEDWNVAAFQRDYLYDSGSIEQCSVYFTFEGGGGYQDVYEYSTISDAQSGIDRLRDVAFSENLSYDTPWKFESDSVLAGLLADTSFLACSESGGRERCQFLARYDEVNLLLFSHLVDDIMPTEGFRDVVRQLDRIVGLQLQEGP